MKLTQQQIDDYIMNPVCCPNGGSRKILSSDTDTDWDVADAWRKVHCSKCNSKWTECFQIWTIDNFERDENGKESKDNY